MYKKKTILNLILYCEAIFVNNSDISINYRNTTEYVHELWHKGIVLFKIYVLYLKLSRKVSNVFVSIY